jgi:hypothetical protein
MHASVDEHKIEIDFTNNQNELNEWVERIGKTANEICSDPDCKLNNLQVLSYN